MSNKKSLTARQMVNQLQKKQDIICADFGVYTTWLILGYQAACAGKEIKATIILYENGKEVQRCPKKGAV